MAHTTPAAEAIGRAVRSALVEAGVSFDEAAKMCGLSVTTFSRRVNGHTGFDFPELFALSRGLGLPLADLVRSAERIVERVPA